MGEKVFYGKGIRQIKKEDSKLYDSIENLDKSIWDGNALDYRTQKLIAIGISATNNESSSFLKQLSKAKKELGYEPVYTYLDMLKDMKRERELARY